MKVKDLYNFALSKLSVSKFDKDFAELYLSRVYLGTIIVCKTFSPYPPEDVETSRKISLLPLSVQGKLECCKGIYELSNGGGERAAQRIEVGLLQLQNSAQNIILKVVGFQFLAIYYKCTNNFAKFEQFRDKTVETCAACSFFRHVPLLGKPLENVDKLNTSCFRDQPLAAWAIARLSLWTRKYPWVKLGTEFGNYLDSFMKQIIAESSKLFGTFELCTLIQLVDKAYIYLGISNNSLDIGLSLTNAEIEKYQGSKDEEDQRRVTLAHERQATYYHTFAVGKFGTGESSLEYWLKELEIRRQLPPDAKLAECYRVIAGEQYSTGEYASAVESYKSALQTLQKLHGEMHEDVANLYYWMANAQYNMGDNEPSFQSYTSALKIYVYLYGNLHPFCLKIEKCINCLFKFPLVHNKTESGQ